MKWGLLGGAGILFILCGAAQAEVGKASADPGTWFLGFSAGGGAVWGPDHEAYRKRISGSPPDYQPVNFDEGTFISGGLEVGYRFQDPASLIDRIELNLDLDMLSRTIDRDTTSAFFALKDDKGNRTAFGFFGFSDPELLADGEENTSDIETRLSFKSMLLDDEENTVLASLEPFFRYQDTDSRLDVTRDGASFASRKDSIEAEYYGLQVALEMEKPISDSLSLVGRASAGGYYVTSDVGSRLEYLGDPEGVPLSTNGDGWGGRFGGALGIKVPLYYSGASLTLLGTVDYMTDVATIDHISIPPPWPDSSTKAAFDDQLEIGGKVGLVFPLR